MVLHAKEETFYVMKRFNLVTIFKSCQVLAIAWQLEFFMSKTEAVTVMYCHPNVNVPNNAYLIIKSRRQVGYLFHYKKPLYVQILLINFE